MTTIPSVIRIFSEASHLEIVDFKVYRCYPALNEKVLLSDSDERYAALEAEMDVSNFKDTSISILVDIDGSYYRYYLNSEGDIYYVTCADSLPPENCPYTTTEWYELPENVREIYALDTYSRLTFEERCALIYGDNWEEKLKDDWDNYWDDDCDDDPYHDEYFDDEGDV